ncbi:MAG: hypothetical protein CVV18_03635 [Gammaproteobacteria bacterium HGW-Gammaproteobacteria-8]|nr:MAG: hypothetical protein CVV18_03635 [Gammaproteobacteria bacterium HGW-Gammaproteobacteria-8]
MHHITPKSSRWVHSSLVAMLVSVSPVLIAQEDDEQAKEEQAMVWFAGQEIKAPDFEKWECKNCNFDYGWSGSVLLGAGYTSDQLFEFGNYRGLDDDGMHANAAIDLQFRAEDGRQLEVYGEDLGLENRDLFVRGGRQGSYTAWLNYDEILQLRADDTRTPFIGAGSNDQRLPDDWVRGQVTGDMSALSDALQPIDIRSKRETIGIGFQLQRQSPLVYAAEVRHTRRDGNRIRGGSFIFRAAELAAPVRYDTTELDASVAFVKQTWEMQVEYNLSHFDNKNRSLRFENPFIGINGASVGELAEAPDNQFHQVMLSGSWRPSALFTLVGQAAIGRIEQDDALLDFTLNPDLANPALPRSAFDGDVDTRVLNLRASSRLSKKLGARISFEYNERDNNSSEDEWLQVVSDTFVTQPRANEPFSHERWTLGGRLDYRALSWLRLSAEARRTETERSFQEVRNSDTDRYSLQARIQAASKLHLNIEGSREERDNDLDPALLGPQENPSLRRFHFAEKERDALRVAADYSITENLAAGLYYEIADEDYTDTRIGLSQARSQSLGLDLSQAFGDRATAHAWVTWERLEGTILGADNVTGSEWRARQDDEFRSGGVGVRLHRLPGGWKQASFDLNYSSAEGDIELSKRGVLDPRFPELRTRRFTLEASAERQMRENLDLVLDYLLGHLSERDFFRDGVDPATVPNLLSLGEGTPGGAVHVIRASLRYHFR